MLISGAFSHKWSFRIVLIVCHMCIPHVHTCPYFFTSTSVMCMCIRWFLRVVIGWLVVTLRLWRGFDGTTDSTTIDWLPLSWGQSSNVVGRTLCSPFNSATPSTMDTPSSWRYLHVNSGANLGNFSTPTWICLLAWRQLVLLNDLTQALISLRTINRWVIRVSAHIARIFHCQSHR